MKMERDKHRALKRHKSLKKRKKLINVHSLQKPITNHDQNQFLIETNYYLKKANPCILKRNVFRISEIKNK